MRWNHWIIKTIINVALPVSNYTTPQSRAKKRKSVLSLTGSPAKRRPPAQWLLPQGNGLHTIRRSQLSGGPSVSPAGCLRSFWPSYWPSWLWWSSSSSLSNRTRLIPKTMMRRRYQPAHHHGKSTIRAAVAAISAVPAMTTSKTLIAIHQAGRLLLIITVKVLRRRHHRRHSQSHMRTKIATASRKIAVVNQQVVQVLHQRRHSQPLTIVRNHNQLLVINKILKRGLPITTGVL